MRKILTLCFLLATMAPTELSAQNKSKDTLVRYFNEYLQPVRKRDAVFAGVIVRDQFGWNTLIYDDSLRILVRGKFADPECKYKDGWFMYYYADGSRATGGRFARNIKVDNWKSWYPNGQLKDSFNYVDNVAEGAARSFHESGVLSAEGVFKNGKFDGPWTFYHENSRPSTKENYKDGKLSQLECFDSSGNSTGFNCAISRPPALVGKYGGIEKYFKDSMHLPLTENREPIEGYVTVEFTITREGKLSNYRVISSHHAELTKEATRLILGISRWYPAVSHNRLVDYTIGLSLPFFVYEPGKEVEQLPLPFEQY